MFTRNCYVYSTVIKLILKNINSNKVLRAHTLFLILFVYHQSNFFLEVNFNAKSNNRDLKELGQAPFKALKFGVYEILLSLGKQIQLYNKKT
jgi:hypothetical protein